MKLNIIYEDKQIIVVYKPAGILSQADITGDMDMLTLIKNYIKEKENKPGDVYLGLVHRLDRMTSGLMVFAKRSKAANRLSEQIKNREFHKEYLCLVEGIIKNDGHLENYLIKNEKLVKSSITTKEQGKLAILDYQVIKNIKNQTLLKVNLKTGRHHQIRVQFANIKHPLVGDALYGNKTNQSLCLHAYKISFYHPITKEYLEFENYDAGFLTKEDI